MGKITSMHFAGWKMGLKTGMYYLRTMAASAPIQFTVDQEQLKVEDKNVARTTKKRAGGAAAATTYSAVPRDPAAQVNGDNKEPTNGVRREAETNGEAENSEEEKKEEGEPTEADIYSQKVLQCSIENKEACIMCQG